MQHCEEVVVVNAVEKTGMTAAVSTTNEAVL